MTAQHARELVEANGVGDVVEVIQAKMEDIELPEKVWARSTRGWSRVVRWCGATGGYNCIGVDGLLSGVRVNARYCHRSSRQVAS